MAKNSIQRFKEIVKTLAFYGFGYIVDTKIKNDTKAPANLRKAFEELGPTFIKIGQILSTRSDILPQDYIEELSKLQDNAPSEPFENINKVFCSEFNKSIEDVFKNFDKTPVASASIAQVHKAVLKNGNEVIVKIQRPEISEKMAIDISILYRIIKLGKTAFTDALIDPKEALDELKTATELELDFKNEAINISKFKELNKNIAYIHTPYVIGNLSTKKILTMEKIDGFKVDNITKLIEQNYILQNIAKNLALSYCKQIFEDGFFHGDPHPGNILISNNKICFIDFGIMGNLSDSLKNSLNDMMFAVAYKDVNKLVSVIMSIGIKKGYVNRNKLFEDIDYLLANYLSTSLENIKISALLEDIFDTAKRNNLKMPKTFTLLARSLIIIEGVITKLSPEIKIIDIIVHYIKSNNKFNLLNDFDINEALIRFVAFGKHTSKLPTKLVELSDSLIQGRTKIQLEHKDLNKNINQLNKMVNRMTLGLVISSMIIASSLIINSNIGPKYQDISLIGIIGYGIAAVIGLGLLLSIIRSGNI
ncbi:AarF/ABC1/UbiB kinase family protein [Clostridium aestuarii]|uniref:AarF/ABC1/UbiB kinase family protein n=1 Tax=Clostridium aestuarii TaxID=338193 RepID=A0ABT4D3N4_9CLOT|nr:AarF/ABC1/UbiB kinase family protein [Clostridium aestuarii]MCY6485856.1 AarF/ABC1/UbiB kinase family protein [Clostridium aestuarii]